MTKLAEMSTAQKVEFGAAVNIMAAQRPLWVPDRIRVRETMASPPTIVWDATCASITGGRLWPSTGASGVLNPVFRYRKAGQPIQAGTVSPNISKVWLTSVNYGTSSRKKANVSGVAFITDGAGVGVGIRLDDASQTVTFKVDGQYVGSTHIGANTGALEYGFIPLTDGKLHEIEVVGSGVMGFAGVMLPQTATLLPAPPRGPRVIVLGDSGVESTGAGGAFASMVVQFGDALGWDDVWASGVGSTGMLNPGTTGKINWLDRIATDVLPFNPDIVWLPGSINDSGYTAAQVRDQASLIIAAIRAGLPRTQIIMSSAWTPRGGGWLPPIQYQQNTALRLLAASLGIPFVDTLEAPMPASIPPQVTTLAEAVTTVTTGTQLKTVAALLPGATYTFDDGQHFIVSSVGGSGPYTINIDKITQVEPAGATITQVGSSAVYGSGSTGNPANNGNGDLVTGSDQTHPTAFGHQVDGTAWALGLLEVIGARLKP